MALLSSLILFATPASTICNPEPEKIQDAAKTLLQASSPNSGLETFSPLMWKPSWVDQDNNGIADTLDREIANRTLFADAGDYVNVTVALKTAPTVDDADAFIAAGGYLTTPAWKYALYGFGGQIPYSEIASFVQSDANVLLVEKEQTCHANVAYAAKQIGARTYVWNTLGLEGDPNSSIAVVDTGIDATHPDFSPGFGDKDFTKKIVGWNNQINGTTTPFDDNGHGSHVSGLAAGDGFFSVDASGYATATWGANLGTMSTGTYLISGMMVNKTGTITIKVKWASAGITPTELTVLPLYYGDKTLSTSSWTQVASVSTPSQNTWYTLIYNVTSPPSGGYDMYHVKMTVTAGTANLYVVFTMSWPYLRPADGFSAWTGIAPQTKLVEVKVLDYSGGGTTNTLLNGINWVVANRQAYHIVITSMSLGSTTEDSTVDAAVANLVKSGITTIVSAGNRNPGSGGNYVYTPGSVDEVITVAATNQFDNIASYSCQGGTSRYTGKTTKPDIAAPGGSFYAVPLFSADSNDNDAESYWSEIQLNDSAPMQGTSMAAPVVSGAAAIIIQAMGGFSKWQWTRSQALQPKMILLMTATETYPNLRENGTSSTSPTLNRGGKDVHEGYGRLNLDAAVDALLKAYQIGTNVTETLGRPPTLSDISVLGQKLAWARKVQLNTQGKYNFTLTVPTGVDFDLYLYNSTGTWYGEPAIVAKSINATTGGHEQIIFTAPYNGTYYLVVKRATATTGGGTFRLESAFMPNHDVTVQTVEPSPTSVYQGNKVNITITVKNKGLNTESFNVTAFYNNTSINKQTVSNLATGGRTTLSFIWFTSGVMLGNYIIKAEASTVPKEYNTTDNTLVYKGTVQVKIPGDVNGDNKVDARDLTQLIQVFGSKSGDSNWNPNADINQDGQINVMDLQLLGKNYGKTI
jgi:subtilisin family serine protease